MKKQKIKQFETKIEKCDKKISKLDKKWNKIHEVFKNYEGYDFKFIKMKFKLQMIIEETKFYIDLKEHYWNKIYDIKEYNL